MRVSAARMTRLLSEWCRGDDVVASDGLKTGHSYSKRPNNRPGARARSAAPPTGHSDGCALRASGPGRLLGKPDVTV